MRMQGTLLWFNSKKRHGFIETADGERLFVEEAGFEPGHLLGDRCAGTPVSFDRDDSPAERPRALRVSILQLDAPRRARQRRH
jgi:cold shock CspA family protein